MKETTFNTAAYGGPGWSGRKLSHQQEIGSIWAECGVQNEYDPLKAVILHCPGDELLASSENPDAVQMLEKVDLVHAREEHAMLAEAYRSHGVEVFSLDCTEPVSPNQMFCADLFGMTPAGAILARPASTVRAGEEVRMARALANLDVPILATLTGDATFESADLIWLHPRKAFLGLGLRTNPAAAGQIADLLHRLDIQLVTADMPYGTMHLMGMLRIVRSDLALCWPRRTPHRVVTELRGAGYEVRFIPESDEFEHGKAFNFVTLGPGKILMVGNNPAAVRFYESLGMECVQTPASELSKAAGAVGCLTGIVHRQSP